MRMARMATGAMQTVKNAFRCEMHNKSAEMQKTFVSDVFPGGGALVALFHAPLRRSMCLRGLVRLLTNSSSRTEAGSRSFR